MPTRTGGAAGVQTPKPRIVQYRNRRYSIRLEPVFWRSLESLTGQRNMRLGQFIAELADGYNGNNFASHLRVVCMVEGERALASASLDSTRESVLDLVVGCPSPGLILSRYRIIVAHNASFLDWLGTPDQALTGTELTSVIQVRTRRPLNDVWTDMLSGVVPATDANVLSVAPGRVIAATARLLALRPGREEDFYAVMWLSTGRTSTLGANIRRAPLAENEPT